MSTRVLTACAILTYAGPRRSTAPRTCARGCAPRRRPAECRGWAQAPGPWPTCRLLLVSGQDTRPMRPLNTRVFEALHTLLARKRACLRGAPPRVGGLPPLRVVKAQPDAHRGRRGQHLRHARGYGQRPPPPERRHGVRVPVPWQLLRGLRRSQHMNALTGANHDVCCATPATRATRAPRCARAPAAVHAGRRPPAPPWQRKRARGSAPCGCEYHGRRRVGCRASRRATCKRSGAPAQPRQAARGRQSPAQTR